MFGKVEITKNTSPNTRSPVVITTSKVKRKYRRRFHRSPSKESRAKKALFTCKVRSGEGINKIA